MKPLLLDTNILLFLLREDSRWRNIYETYDVENRLNCISVVSLGELNAIALRNSWGECRIQKIDQLAQDFTIVDIHVEEIIKCYGEIDAFSQGKHPTRPLSMTARNMGKNDLWIAATASVFDIVLVTSDADFNHLNGNFLDLVKI